MTETSERLARMETIIEHQGQMLTEVRSDVREMHDALQRGRGAWVTMTAFGGLAGFLASQLGAFKTWIVGH